MPFISLGYMGATAPKKTPAKPASKPAAKPVARPAPRPLPKKETRQASTNAVAAHFRKLGIPLERPDARHPFWRQPAKVIADKLANAVNTLPVPTLPSSTHGWY
jgi:hypothetical protein